MEKEGDKLLITELDKIIKPSYVILEFGSGYCETLKSIIQKYNILGYGIDPYGSDINTEKLKCYKIEAEEMHLLNTTFNVIYSIRSFHHLNNIHKFFEEAVKNLKGKGYLITVDWKKGANTGIPERYFSLTELRKYYLKYGFKIVTANEGENSFLITGIKEEV